MFNLTHSKIKYSRGFSLIEVIIVLSLSTLALGILINIYNAYWRSNQQLQSLTTMLSNATKIIHALEINIHYAGHIGCPTLKSGFKIYSKHTVQISAQTALTGMDHNIEVQYMQVPVGNLIRMVERDQIIMSSNPPVHQGRFMIISDCLNGEIFSVKKVVKNKTVQKIFLSNLLHNEYKTYAEISSYVQRKFYIAKTARKNQQGGPVFALFQQDWEQKPLEIAEGVNQINFLYTVGHKDLPAAEVLDWSKVTGVVVNFQMETADLKKNFYDYVAVRQ